MIQKLLEDYSLVITNPTLNFSELQSILSWIDNTASYLMIPAIAQEVPLDPWKVVLNLFPHSNNLIIDICLPYVQMKPQGAGSVRHSARYFISNKKLLGIRIKSGQKWQKYKSVKVRLPQSIIRFYHQQQSQDERVLVDQECQVGFLYLTFKHFKIAPIFQSQMNEKLLLLGEFERYGCEIFSIVDDISKKKVGQVSKLQPQLFQQSKTTKNVIIYSGIKQSSHPLLCYWTNAFVLYNNNFKKCSVNPFDAGAQIKVNINIVAIRKAKKYQQINNKKDGTKIISGINARNCYIQWANLSQGQSKQLPEQKPSGQTILMMFTWYIFHMINHRQPFILGAPFTQKITCLLYVLRDIVLYLKKNKIVLKEKPIILYKTNDKTNNRMWPDALDDLLTNVTLYQNLNELLQTESKKSQALYFYTDAVDQIHILAEHSLKFKKIHICKSALANQYLSCKINRQYLNCAQVAKSQKKQLERLCNQILLPKDHTLQNMVTTFLKKNNNINELMEAFTQIIPRKIKLNIGLNVHHLSLLGTSREEICQNLKQIEYHFSNYSNKKQKNPHEKTMMQEEGKSSVIIFQQKTSLRQKIKRANLFRQNNSKTLSICHQCQEVFKKIYLKNCNRCRKSICYECLAKAMAIQNKQMQINQFENLAQEKCPVCTGTCRCGECVIKLDKTFEKKAEKVENKAPQQYHIKPCDFCLLGNHQRIPIDLQCYNCKKIFCMQCQKRQKVINQSYYKDKWLCKKCSFYQIIGELGGNDNKRSAQKQVFLTANQNPEVIKLKEQFEKKQQGYKERIKELEAANKKSKQQNEELRNKDRNRSNSRSSSSSSRPFSSNSSNSAKSRKKQNKSRSESRHRQVRQDKGYEGRGRGRGQRDNFNKYEPRGRGRGKQYNKQFNNDRRGRGRGRGDWHKRDNYHNSNNSQRNFDHAQQSEQRADRNNYEQEQSRNKPLWNSQENTEKQNKSNKLLIFDSKPEVIQQEIQY